MITRDGNHDSGESTCTMWESIVKCRIIKAVQLKTYSPRRNGEEYSVTTNVDGDSRESTCDHTYKNHHVEGEVDTFVRMESQVP